MNMTHEELFVKILDQMPFGVYCVDTDRKIFYWSKGAERISGYKAEDMLGKHCFESHLDHIDENGTHLCHAMCPLVATDYPVKKPSGCGAKRATESLSSFTRSPSFKMERRWALSSTFIRYK